MYKKYKINSVYAGRVPRARRRQTLRCGVVSAASFLFGHWKRVKVWYRAMERPVSKLRLKAVLRHCRTRRGRNSVIHRYTVFLFRSWDPIRIPTGWSLRVLRSPSTVLTQVGTLILHWCNVQLLFYYPLNDIYNRLQDWLDNCNGAGTHRAQFTKRSETNRVTVLWRHQLL